MQEEGEERHRNAQIGLREIVDSSDMYVINANDVLVENSRGITLPYAFRIMDKRLARVVNSICRMQSTTVAPGVINVDFSNFQRLAAGGGLGFIGVGEGGKVHSSMEDALSDDFAGCDLTGAREAIIYFEGKEFLLDSDEVRKATRHVSEHYRIPTVFMGMRPTWDLRDTRTTIIVSGVSSGYVDKFLKGGE
jgi:cell division GTPase FtsZ